MTPFVLIADIDNAVILVTTVVVSINTKASRMPACPTTQLRRKNSITPHILSRQRTSTPLIQPNLIIPFNMLFEVSRSELRRSISNESRGGGSRSFCCWCWHLMMADGAVNLKGKKMPMATLALFKKKSFAIFPKQNICLERNVFHSLERIRQIKEIFGLHGVEKDSAVRLCQFIDKWRVPQSTKEKIGEALLFHLTTKKSDARSQMRCKESVLIDKFPLWSSIESVLNNRCRILENMHSYQADKLPNHRTNTAQSKEYKALQQPGA
uniref:Uncharacterized protein n=1 Tax=Glossina austeni TaxID=7395 RepID=A0A1A9UTS9_GLOAU